MIRKMHGTISAGIARATCQGRSATQLRQIVSTAASGAVSVPATCPSGGAIADSQGYPTSNASAQPQVSQSAGDSDAAPQTSQADSPTLSSNLPRVGHTWDGAQWSIETKGVAAGHRRGQTLRRDGL